MEIILNVANPNDLKTYAAAEQLMTARVLNSDDFYYEIADKLFIVVHMGNNSVIIKETLPPNNYSQLKAYGI